MEAAGRLSFDLVNMLELEIQSNKLHVNEVQVRVYSFRNNSNSNKGQQMINLAKESTTFSIKNIRSKANSIKSSKNRKK